MNVKLALGVPGAQKNVNLKLDVKSKETQNVNVKVDLGVPEAHQL